MIWQSEGIFNIFNCSINRREAKLQKQALPAKFDLQSTNDNVKGCIPSVYHCIF